MAVVLICLRTTHSVRLWTPQASTGSQTIQFPPAHSEVQEAAGAEAPDAAAAEAAPSSSSPAPEAAASSSSAQAAPSSPGAAAKEAPSSPKLVMEADRASQMSGSGCTSQASVDDEDDVPITDIYFVSTNHPHTHTHTHTYTRTHIHAHTPFRSISVSNNMKVSTSQTKTSSHPFSSLSVWHFYLPIKSSLIFNHCVLANTRFIYNEQCIRDEYMMKSRTELCETLLQRRWQMDVMTQAGMGIRVCAVIACSVWCVHFKEYFDIYS